MSHNKSVQSEGLVSDEQFQAWLVGEIHSFLNVERVMSREQLANAAGLTVSMLDAIRKAGEGRRKVGPGIGLSLCYVMGERRVNGMLAQIGFGGATSLDNQQDGDVRNLVADLLPGLSVIGEAAKDGRIDHIEQPHTTKAADDMIARLIPLSSFNRT